MTFTQAKKWVINLTKRKEAPFSTFKRWKKKDKYDDLENKHLYWSINNMKKEYLTEEKNDNFFQCIENAKVEEHISDIVGIDSSIPDNRTINENTEKYFQKEGTKKEYIPKDKLERINQIFNPSLKIFVDNKKKKYEDSSIISLFQGTNLEKGSKDDLELHSEKLHGGLKNEGVQKSTKLSFMNKKVEKMRQGNNVNYTQYDTDLAKEKGGKNVIEDEENRNLIPNCINDDPELKKGIKGRRDKKKKWKDEQGKIANNENDLDEEYNFPRSNELKENSIFDYESMKGKKGTYQDLTHDEYAYMNNLYIKKCDVDRKIRWFKMSNILNPIKEAKSIVKAQRLSADEEEKKNTNDGMCDVEGDQNFHIRKKKQMEGFPLEEDIKPYYENEGDFSYKINKICEQNQYDEIVSRIRMKIRKEKMGNSKIMKEKIPNVARHILDPIKYHVNRRRIRVEKLLHTHLEQLLNCNNSYFKFYLLNGLSISIHHLEMKSTRSLCKIVYTLLNKNINHEMIKEKLDKVAFVLRKLLARKLQLGYTPPLKFVPLQDQQEKNIKNLHYYKLYAKYNYPNFKTSNISEKGTQLMNFYTKDLSGF
ncbi:hypothetical protein, conserved [Plasmodium gonderi]|uniref:Ribosome-binding factor A n=1 Tax=Plasmodium gonderi TaxID=77519 RepID=A0A1Y1JQH9_PLAGO|nr:hypothetical protein, conserved [Plasmodium gonderi]GAW83778.1 hypothetical protein, conserved [Plasmodium gonderi]